jgi:hypothetical protein
MFGSFFESFLNVDIVQWKGFPLFSHPCAMSSRTHAFKSSQLYKMGRNKTNQRQNVGHLDE